MWHCLELIEYHGVDTKQHAESKEQALLLCATWAGKRGQRSKKSTAGLIVAWFYVGVFFLVLLVCVYGLVSGHSFRKAFVGWSRMEKSK